MPNPGNMGWILVLLAVTFDFWNTLYKGPPDAAVSEQRALDVQQILAAEGFQFELPALSEAFKSAWREAYYTQKVYGRDPGPGGQVAHLLNKLGVKQLRHPDDLYDAYTTTLLKLPPQINDGVPETLKTLGERLKLAVICNTGATPGLYLRQIMKKDQLFDYFNYLVFSDEVVYAKPDPMIFKLTIEQLGCGPEKAVHVGDDPITDVIGARKAGMKAVWLAPGAEWRLPEADYHIKKVPDLLNLV